MAQRFDPTQPAADRIRAVRDAYLIPTPDKTDTAYAVLTSAADDVGGVVTALTELLADVDLIVQRGDRAAAIDPIFTLKARIALAKATGQAVPA